MSLLTLPETHQSRDFPSIRKNGSLSPHAEQVIWRQQILIWLRMEGAQSLKEGPKGQVKPTGLSSITFNNKSCNQKSRTLWGFRGRSL